MTLKPFGLWKSGMVAFLLLVSPAIASSQAVDQAQAARDSLWLLTLKSESTCSVGTVKVRRLPPVSEAVACILIHAAQETLASGGGVEVGWSSDDAKLIDSASVVSVDVRDGSTDARVELYWAVGLTFNNRRAPITVYFDRLSQRTRVTLIR